MDQMLEQVLDRLRGMWRRRFVGLAVAWLAGMIGLIVVFMIPPRYEASARLFVDTQSVLKPLMAGLTVQPNIDQQIGILSRTLLSRPNMEKLMRMADLDAGVNAPAERDALAERLMKSIRLTAEKGNIFSLTYRDSSPERAKRTVESLLSIFVESGLGKKRLDTEKARRFLDAQIQEYEQKLAAAERRLKDFKVRNLRVLGSGHDSLATLSQLDEQIGQARTEYNSAVQGRDALRRQLQGEEPVFLPDPNQIGRAPGEGSVSEFDGRIDALRKNLDELASRYTDQHPDVIATRRMLTELEEQRAAKLKERSAASSAPGAPAAAMSADRNPVYQQLKVALADAESNIASIRARVEDLQARYNRISTTTMLRPELDEELAQLNRDYAVHKANYTGLVARRESAQLTGELDETGSVADFKIVDPPRVSPTPVEPQRPLLLGVVVLMSIGAGLAASFGVSEVLPIIMDRRTLQSVTQRPVLGVLSLQPSPQQRRARRRRTLAFAGAAGGLFVLYGVAFVVLTALGGPG
jgi:polysaccharide chain length determinant protein (PEP-CTERM system associated)